jgi:hypothetical protein
MPVEDEGAADPGGFRPVDDAEITTAIEAEDVEKPADEPATTAETPPGELVYEIGGKKYTATQIAELEKGSMRLQDYSKDKNALTERERDIEEREQRLRDQEDRVRRGRGQDPENDTEPETVEERLARIEQEQATRDYNAHAERAVGVYERTLDSLFKEHGITDPEMQKRIDTAINDFNPDTRNLKQLEKSVRGLFDVIASYGKKATDQRLDQIRKTPKVPSAKGTGVVPVSPGTKKRPSFDDPVTEEELAGGG